MAEQPVTPERVSPERFAAGRDYLTALHSNGLRPEALMWAWNRQREDLVLLLVTSLVDRVGPEAVYRTLFQAFDSAVTPAAIDPWIVEVYSPDTIFAAKLERSFELRLGGGTLVMADGQHQRNAYFTLMAERYSIVADWVYVRPEPKPKANEQLAGWRRFRRHVEAAAAA